MKIIYFGNGPRGLKCLQSLLEAKKELVAVIGHPGRQNSLIDFASAIGLPVFQPDSVNATKFLKELRKLNSDLFILSGYNQILKTEIIHIPQKGCINLHGGKLPEYRGAAPINWQIINGETVGGCCIIYVDEGIDTGPILDQQFYEISETDTSANVIDKQLNLFPKMLLSVVKKIEKGIAKSIPQDKNAGCYFPKRCPKDGLINWEVMTAQQVYNLVRALVDPYPNAFTFFEGRKVRIKMVKKVNSPLKGIPGRIPVKTSEGILVCCKDKVLLITEVAFGEEKKIYNPKDKFTTGTKFNN